MNHGEERAELRGAVYRGDAGPLAGILKREAWLENALQLIGDGLLLLLHAPTKGIDEAAHRCVTALWDRGWEGDSDLAAGLEAALGSGPVPLLRPLPVAGSRTNCRGGQNCSNGGTPSARIGSADGLGRGWPARGTLSRHTSQGRDRQVRAKRGL